MMRFCPNCETERDLAELVCEGTVNGHSCGWDLSDVPIRPKGWRPHSPAKDDSVDTSAPTVRTCSNGHPVDEGDLICPVCGANVDDAEDIPPAAPAPTTDADHAQPPEQPTSVDGWRLEGRLPVAGRVRERFCATHEDGRQGVLTLYALGSDPDPDVQDVLRSLPREHVPEFQQTGRWEGRAYEVTERFEEVTLANLGWSADLEELPRIVAELGSALAALAEHGLRHRDLRPGSIVVRSSEPLDLVITEFGSARLSDLDLDVVSPLETSRYMAPEAVAGGVAAASDWWSLGMILLDRITRGECFAGADDQAFLIHVLANGVPLPASLDPAIALLMRGLLARDRRERWGWPQVRRWLDGERPDAPGATEAAETSESRKTFELAGVRHGNLARLALAAAQAGAWDEMLRKLLDGELATWMEEVGLSADVRRHVRDAIRLEGVSDDIRLALVLKGLNPAMPLVVRGEIVTPGWLLDRPTDGYALVAGEAPAFLDRIDAEQWLGRIRRRLDKVRERARQLDVALDEDEFRVNALSTSRSRLAAVWDERRRVLPDSDHPGLLAILERRIEAEEDLILLLSANISQFRAADAIAEEAADLAGRTGVSNFDREAALHWLRGQRRDMNVAIEARVSGFARCGRETIDAWADQYRLERRLPIQRALVLLSVPQEDWREPPKQAYVATLLDFYSRRITGAVMRGPLTRMVIGKTTSRIDVTEIGSARTSAKRILDHLLLRNDQQIEIDPAQFADDPSKEKRIRTLYSHATLYRRDTGIDGLYLGFPFLVMQEARPGVKPRIAPVLLWPIKLRPEVGTRGRVSVAFDRDREEVRLNPAFETLLGIERAQLWADAARDILGRATVTAAEVVEAFHELAAVGGGDIVPLPGKDLKVKVGEDRIACSAVLFHLAYIGQAVMEDLRQMRSVPPAGSALETALRVGDDVIRTEIAHPPEIERYFTAQSDPSQETAVLEARSGNGLLIEGPPGTGKSQTIVNMVADAIGTGRSLLVVCQKQSALEVVHKRLEADGLGDRIVMVNDVNKDREPIIRAVREQLESLSQKRPGGSSWRQARRQLASRIETLESDLNAHHAAMHAVEDRTGLSYRLVVGELIQLADGGGTIPPVPTLRRLLGPLDPGAVSALEERCSSLAALWLQARFENSPLGVLRQFDTDEGTLGAFDDDVRRFLIAEGDRAEVIARTQNSEEIEEAEPYREWASRNAAEFRNIPEHVRERLARWLPLFTDRPDTGATPLREQLERVFAALALEQPDVAPDAAVAVATQLGDKDLDQWIPIFDRLAGKPSFLARLSPSRWLERRKCETFLRQHGLGDTAEIRQALHQERRIRPLRNGLKTVLVGLSEPFDGLASLRADALLARAKAAQADFDVISGLVSRLASHPVPSSAMAMARAGTRQAVDELMSSIEGGLARHAARAASRKALDALGAWFSEEWIATYRPTLDRHVTDIDQVRGVVAARPTMAAYQRFRARTASLGEAELAVFAPLDRIRTTLEAVDGGELEATVRRIVANEARLAWKARIEAAHPSLLFQPSELEAKTAALAVADAEMRDLNRRLLVEGVEATDLSPLREWEDITRLRGQRARRLREFLDRGVDLGLMRLKPVWLVNPDVASRLLPLKKSVFDRVIFDEASQMPIEYALPTLFRSKAMVVSGDEKQMPPTNFFASRVESDEAEIFEGHAEDEGEIDEEERDAHAETWNRREIKDCPDLLQLAKSVLPSTTLQIHYRSAYRELIQFSNAAFYSNRLSVPARHPDDEIRRVRPIEVVRADGVYEDQTNRIEAERVADVLAKLWGDAPGRRKTVGVVTFNRKQADLIEEVIEERAEEDPVFRKALAQERERVEGGEDMGFFVKNVENVQGDERDVMVFSSTFGKNAQGTFRRFFGVLGQVGGERRLNVAVTRAREKVILVTSMPISMISDMLSTRRSASAPRDYLQAYFEYARAVSDGELDEGRFLLGRLTPERREAAGQRQDADGFQQSIAAEIAKLGWSPVPVEDDGAFSLDFAIEDPRTGLYGIGIECDAPRHGLLAGARAREIWRPKVLKRSIPVVHRVSSHRWYHDNAAERAKLANAIREALGEAA